MPSLSILSRQPDERFVCSEYDDPDGNGTVRISESSTFDMVEQIKTHLNYYRSHEKKKHSAHYKDEVLDKILLCGGGANLKGLSNFLSSELKIPVGVANTWTNIQREPLKDIPKLPAEKSLCYTTALGLALRGVIDN